MSTYANATDQSLLQDLTEQLQNAFTDTPGTDDERWQAVVNEALERTSAGAGFELLKRRRKWGQPNTTPPDPTQLPPSTPIVTNPDALGIALSSGGPES